MNPFIVSLAIRLTILLLAGGLVAIAVRRSTHALRHVVIAATLACVVALPAMMALVPEWRVGVLPSAPTLASIVIATPARAATPAIAPASRESIRPVLVTSQLSPAGAPSGGAAASTIEEQPIVTWARALTAPQIVLAIWLAGVFFGLAWIAVGRIGLARVRRGATQLRTYEWRTILEAEAMHAGVARRVELFTSPSVSMPVTWGVLKPIIVLPEASLAWTHDRKRVVVMHEMAHIARRDSATQLVATLACVAYWLHPLVLLAARRLRAECERACDERVLERGTPAAEYAAHLLDVARFSRSFGAASIVSVAMARPSQLEGRLLAVLRAEPRPARTSARARALTAALAVSMLMAISAFRPVERAAHARVTIPTTVHTSLAPTLISQAPVESVLAAPKASKAHESVLPARFTKSDSVFQKSVPVHTDGTLELDLDTGGDIEIIGGDDSKVVVDGSLGGRDWRSTTVELEGLGGDARLASRYVGSSGTQMFDNAFKIHVPKKFNVRLTSSGGNVSISGVEGRFTGSTAGGKIEIDHAMGEANLTTGGGNVRVSNSHLDGVVATGGGTMNFEDVTGGISGGSGSDPRMFGGFNFKWPKTPMMPKMPKMVVMSKIDVAPLAPLERSRAEMEREQGMMEREQARMERNRDAMERQQAFMDEHTEGSDSAMQRSRENMERFRETMERSQKLMDSARIIIERNRGAMDTVNIVMRRELAPLRFKYDLGTLKYDVGSMKYDKDEADIERDATRESREWAKDPDTVIVVDKNGGSIRVMGTPRSYEEARAATATGAITVSAGKGEAHAIDVRSVTGNIDVMIPKGANVTLDLEAAYTEAFGRQPKISADFPIESTVTPDWDSSQGAPRKYVRVKQKIGKGGPLIRVRTVNGDIRLRDEG